MFRKENEITHGYMVEGTPFKDIQRLVFVDDFISSGDTLDKVISIAAERKCSIAAMIAHDPDNTQKRHNGIDIFGATS